MVPIAGHREAQQGLQQSLRVGCRKQVIATSHERDALIRVVHHHGKVIAHSQVLAAKYQIAEQGRLRGDAPGFPRRSLTRFFKAQFTNRQLRNREADIQPQRVGCALGQAGFPLVVAQVSARSGVQRPVRSLRSPSEALDFPGDGASRTEARIDQATVRQAVKGCPVEGQSL